MFATNSTSSQKLDSSFIVLKQTYFDQYALVKLSKIMSHSVKVEKKSLNNKLKD